MVAYAAKLIASRSFLQNKCCCIPGWSKYCKSVCPQFCRVWSHILNCTVAIRLPYYLWHWASDVFFVHPRVIHEWIWRNSLNYIDRGKPKYCPSVTLSTTDPKWTDPGAKPGLQVEKPVTNHLSYGTTTRRPLSILQTGCRRQRRTIKVAVLISTCNYS
jgi:hypothetical protein